MSYTVSTQWSSGFTANVNVTNLGDPINGWRLTWSFSAGQTVTQAWNASATQSGSAVTVTDAGYNAAIATNATASFGFNGTWNGSTNPSPTAFALNGVSCTGGVSSPTATPTGTRSPSPTPSRTVSPSPTPSRTVSPSPTPTSGGGTSSPPPVPGTPGSWTAVPVNPYNGGAGTFMWLMTDGSILSNGSDLHQWVKLVPDQFGDYTKGTWVQLATSPYGVGAAQEQILPDGRFYQAGGEYVYQWPSGSSSNDHNGVQLYNPVTNTWTLGQSGLYGNLWDTGTAHLKDGRIVASDQRSARTQIFNPSTNSWTAGPNRPASAAEDGWVPLPDGSIVSISNGGAYRYDPAANAWYTVARPPSSYASGSTDTSTVTLMYDGRILAMGHNTSVIYTPGAKPSDPGSWAQGPAIPQGSFVDDVYATPEGNGKVIYDSVRCSWLTNECGSASGALINEFDPATNTMATISQPNDSRGAPVNFINLPNGQVLAAAGSRNWVYTPVGSPKAAWRPTVTSVTGSGTYHLTGTQLSGLVSLGEDDYQNPQNYPIVYLKDSAGHVYFARTANFSSMITSKPGETQTTDFTLPSSLAHGSYTLYVSACGVSSAGYAFTY
ncbi:cellulose binding domain-containing protein [Rugosimonospora africana]|uniref:cellulose binding domain-containing protein n=1 Tax=Rugosimonospora africana TaxID=556532 RepID=UPI001EF234C4|nr:cellulose binding domain-containing protein [Rugosimonospora africana]